jgi:glycosyltransferase domain-containing protein
VSPDEIELLSELTIIIPTYNRPLELERAIEYWRDIPVTVHILDGSQKPCFEVGAIVSSGAKITYHSLPTKANEKFMENYSLRINEGMSLIKSKYAALLADDDYFTLHGLCTSLELLSSNDKIDAVIGKCATYCLYGNEIEWKKKYLNWIPNELLKDESLAIRIKNDVGKYFVYYGILKSEKLIEIHTRANRFVFSDFRVNELVAHHLGLTYCRTEVIEEYLWIRQKALVKNPSYEHEIRSSDQNENLILSDIFSDAITDIEPLVSAELKSTWSARKVKLIEERLRADDLKYSSTVTAKQTKILVAFAKRGLMALFLLTPRWLQFILLKSVLSGYLNVVNAEQPPEFESKQDMSMILTKPREELRLRANI